MINKKEIYIVECDSCNELLDDMDYGAFTVYKTIIDAEAAIEEMGWQPEVGGKHLCYACAEAME